MNYHGQRIFFKAGPSFIHHLHALIRFMWSRIRPWTISGDVNHKKPRGVVSLAGGLMRKRQPNHSVGIAEISETWSIRRPYVCCICIDTLTFLTLPFRLTKPQPFLYLKIPILPYYYSSGCWWTVSLTSVYNFCHHSFTPRDNLFLTLPNRNSRGCFSSQCPSRVTAKITLIPSVSLP